MANRLGIGIIGSGRIANSHMHAMQQHERSNVVGVMDVLPDRVASFAEEYGIPKTYTNLDDLLANRDVDAVIVSTPPFAHMEPTIAALEAGKHVLCEKPFSLVPTEAERMVATADRAGKFLAVCSARYRHNQAAVRAHEMSASGELGHVYHARSSSFRIRGRPGIDMFQDAPWFIDKSRAGGGALIDIGVYQIDLLLWLLGNPRVKSVLASTYMGIGAPATGEVAQSVEDHAVVMMECENGASAILEIAWASNLGGADTLLVLGAEAGLRFHPLTKITAEDRAVAEERARQETDPQRRGFVNVRAVERRIFEDEEPQHVGFYRVTTAFVDDVIAGRQPMTPPRDALEVTRVIDAAYRSAETGEAVRLAKRGRTAIQEAGGRRRPNT